MPTIKRADGYEISTDPGRLDLDLVHRWLSTDAYWALGRGRDVVARAAEGSLLFGVYAPGGTQVAVARAVTDSATFAWLCDVYVDRAERGRGLGSWLVGVVRDELTPAAYGASCSPRRTRTASTPSSASGRWRSPIGGWS